VTSRLGAALGESPTHSRILEPQLRVVALLACHNRKELTLRCLESFFSQSVAGSSAALEAVIVDDGSTDGTAEAVRASFAAARVVAGDGTLYWARGMQLAEANAISARPDYFLWLNDDVTLDADALDRLLGTAEAFPDAIIAAALLDPDTGAVAYSGVVLGKWHPLRARLVEPGDHPVAVDTFNGNLVLVPRVVYERVGPIDGGFSHSQADFDFGLRAREAGFRVVLAAGAFGACRRGVRQGGFDDTTLSLGQRWRLVQSATGLPMRSHARYLRRHGGPLWPIFWAAPYVKLALSAIAAAPGRWRARSG
jgi:GT2 family glycosyltransferase